METVRIVTQPYTRYTAGMKRDEALTFLSKLDELSGKLKFSGNIGVAMVADGDDASSLDMLAQALATTKLNASLVIAGDDGIHWRAIREAARLIKNIAQRSSHGGGNFNFAATAMVKPYGPFYPGRVPPGHRTHFRGRARRRQRGGRRLHPISRPARGREAVVGGAFETYAGGRSGGYESGFYQRLDVRRHRSHARAVG